MRKDKDGNSLVVACNFTPVPRENYKIGVNEAGVYEEVLNSDAREFFGSGIENKGEIETGEGWNFKPYAIKVHLPPLATVVYQLKKKK